MKATVTVSSNNSALNYVQKCGVMKVYHGALNSRMTCHGFVETFFLYCLCVCVLVDVYESHLEGSLHSSLVYLYTFPFLFNGLQNCALPLYS